jgi:hypothetical protein
MVGGEWRRAYPVLGGRAVGLLGGWADWLPVLSQGAAPCYISSMDRDYWTSPLREAELELEAATSRTAVNAAAKKGDACQGRAESARGALAPGAGPSYALPGQHYTGVTFARR